MKNPGFFSRLLKNQTFAILQKENHLNQTSMNLGSILIFQGVGFVECTILLRVEVPKLLVM